MRPRRPSARRARCDRVHPRVRTQPPHGGLGVPVGEPAEAIEAPQANVSQHLAILREVLVDTERRGVSVIYSLRYPRVLEAIDIMREVQADEAARRAGLVA